MTIPAHDTKTQTLIPNHMINKEKRIVYYRGFPIEIEDTTSIAIPVLTAHASLRDN